MKLQLNYHDLSKIAIALKAEAKAFDKVRMKAVGNRYRNTLERVIKLQRNYYKIKTKKANFKFQ